MKGDSDKESSGCPSIPLCFMRFWGRALALVTELDTTSMVFLFAAQSRAESAFVAGAGSFLATLAKGVNRDRG
jgi:hypothetical protein